MDTETTRSHITELFGRVNEVEKAHAAMAQTNLLLTGMVNKHDSTLYGDGQQWLGLVANQQMLVDMHKEMKAEDAKEKDDLKSDKWQKWALISTVVVGILAAMATAVAPIIEKVFK